MSDRRAQLRDYVDELTRRVIDDPATSGAEGLGDRRTGPRRWRVALASLAIALLAGVALIAVAGGDSDRSVVATGQGSFIPPVSMVGDRTRLHLVFPDGSRVDLLYPNSVDLAQLGFEPEAAVNYSPYGEGPDRPDRASPQPCCGRGLTIRRGTIREVMGDRVPTKIYRGPRGQDVPFFDSTAIGAGPPDLPQLAFQFGAWTVLAYDYPASDPRGTRMTDQQRAVFASNLDGHQNAQGFLLLEPRPPLCLATALDGPNGVLGNVGPVVTDTVLFYLKGLPHAPGEVISERTSRGYGVLHRSRIHRWCCPTTDSSCCFQTPLGYRTISRSRISSRSLGGDVEQRPLWTDRSSALRLPAR